LYSTVCVEQRQEGRYSLPGLLPAYILQCKPRFSSF
jgi:hypothetical protein